MCQPNCWELIINTFYWGTLGRSCPSWGFKFSFIRIVMVCNSQWFWAIVLCRSWKISSHWKSKESSFSVSAVLNYCTVQIFSNNQRSMLYWSCPGKLEDYVGGPWIWLRSELEFHFGESEVLCFPTADINNCHSFLLLTEIVDICRHSFSFWDYEACRLSVVDFLKKGNCK